LDDFTVAIREVEGKCAELMQSATYTYADLPKSMPETGIYMFLQNGQVLYVGRTNRLRKRLQYHIRNNHNQATFAFLLARHSTGQKKASYKKAGSRNDLLNNNEFREEFDKARRSIREMDLKFIEERDPTKQALLEICVAMKTRAKYNDFDNH
jgi:predicted GIY-YIG superfamily endonuclease